jgi:hypothetical protein
MNFDAWETIWICVALSALVLLIDAWQASCAGPDKKEIARTGQRSNRMAQLGKGKFE